METTVAKKRSRGRRRNRLGLPERSLPPTLDKSVANLLSVLVRSQLQTQQRLRMLYAAVVDTFIVKASSAIPTAMAEEMARFSRDVEAYRAASEQEPESRPPQPGSPVATVFLAFLEALATQNIGGRNLEAVQALLKELEQMGDGARSHIESRVATCPVDMLKGPQNADKAKIVIAMDRLEARLAIVNSLAQLVDVEHKHGPAPPGYLEMDLEGWLGALSLSSK